MALVIYSATLCDKNITIWTSRGDEKRRTPLNIRKETIDLLRLD